MFTVYVASINMNVLFFQKRYYLGILSFCPGHKRLLRPLSPLACLSANTVTPFRFAIFTRLSPRRTL